MKKRSPEESNEVNRKKISWRVLETNKHLTVTFSEKKSECMASIHFSAKIQKHVLRLK